MDLTPVHGAFGCRPVGFRGIDPHRNGPLWHRCREHFAVAPSDCYSPQITSLLHKLWNTWLDFDPVVHKLFKMYDFKPTIVGDAKAIQSLKPDAANCDDHGPMYTFKRRFSRKSPKKDRILGQSVAGNGVKAHDVHQIIMPTKMSISNVSGQKLKNISIDASNVALLYAEEVAHGLDIIAMNPCIPVQADDVEVYSKGSKPLDYYKMSYWAASGTDKQMAFRRHFEKDLENIKKHATLVEKIMINHALHYSLIPVNPGDEGLVLRISEDTSRDIVVSSLAFYCDTMQECASEAFCKAMAPMLLHQKLEPWTNQTTRYYAGLLKERKSDFYPGIYVKDNYRLIQKWFPNVTGYAEEQYNNIKNRKLPKKYDIGASVPQLTSVELDHRHPQLKYIPPKPGTF